MAAATKALAATTTGRRRGDPIAGRGKSCASVRWSGVAVACAHKPACVC
jgi:hypothetical protein